MASDLRTRVRPTVVALGRGLERNALTVYDAVRKWEHSEPRENVLMYVGGVIFAAMIGVVATRRT
jgi:hypothetical protein